MSPREPKYFMEIVTFYEAVRLKGQKASSYGSDSQPRVYIKTLEVGVCRRKFLSHLVPQPLSPK